MRVLIIGGHLSPALSVMGYLKEDDVFYVGRKYALEGDSAESLEYQTIRRMGIPFFEINTARLQRKFTKHTLTSLTKFPIGFVRALKIIKSVNPDVVLGFGGYVSVPLVIAAYFLKVPVVLHEQTLEAGLANKFLARFAKKICISWESSREFFSKNKSVLTGNPLKHEVISVKSGILQKDSKLPLIYITGGSLGSHFINGLVLKSLLKLLKKYIIFHQTGDAREFNDFEKLTEIKNNLPKEFSQNYKLVKFLSPHDSALAMYNADLVISRAGINTVCELIYLKKLAFLIPLSFSQRNEQLKNALFLKKLGIAEVGEEKLLDETAFVSIIESMIKKLKLYQLNQKDVLVKDAEEKIIRVLKNVSKKEEA